MNCGMINLDVRIQYSENVTELCDRQLCSNRVQMSPVRALAFSVAEVLHIALFYQS